MDGIDVLTRTETELVFRTAKLQAGDKPLVEEVEIAVARGDVCVLMGSSGCGKTTLLESILRASIRQRIKVGYSPQGGAVFPWLTVADNLAFDARAGREQALEMLDELSLKIDLKDQSGSTPSGGECARIGLGRALLSHPEILLLDEPLSGLDPSAKERCGGAIRKRSQDRFCILVAHGLDEAFFVGSSIYVMGNGQSPELVWTRASAGATRFGTGDAQDRIKVLDALRKQE